MTTEQKNRVIDTLVSLLDEGREAIIEANQKDLRSCGDIDASLLDRLKINDQKIDGMIAALRFSKQVEDPEGKTIHSYKHENGLLIENKAVPFGKILIIYESRPDVTIEASVTAFKAGNTVLLKGGKEAKHTNNILVDFWHKALQHNNQEQNYITYLDLDREETQALIKDNTHDVDLIIPRGGEGLIHFVTKHTSLPVIVSGRGNNFLYLDKVSDFNMAIDIILNGKQRISVCNALDKVLIHKSLPDLKSKVSQMVHELKEQGIQVLGDSKITQLDTQVHFVQGETIFLEEFLAPKILLAMVDDVDQAINMINRYSGGHSAAIVSTDKETAQKFQNEVDCAAVYHNASTRFTDGGQMGFGAEIAISTQKLHFRGPIGADQLVTNKWLVYGTGQIRL